MQHGACRAHPSLRHGVDVAAWRVRTGFQVDKWVSTLAHTTSSRLLLLKASTRLDFKQMVIHIGVLHIGFLIWDFNPSLGLN